jgi:PKHD-type hydroxylase
MFNLKSYNDSTPTSNWNTFYYYKNIFNDQMINKLTTDVTSNYDFSKGRTGVKALGTDTDSYKTNNRDIAYIGLDPNFKWLYDTLWPLVTQANDELFHFDIDIVTDPIHYVIYPTPTTPQTPDGGHLDWHMDVGAHGVNKRKLAMTVQLSDPKDYDGGDFEIWFGGDRQVLVPREKGDVIIFPAFCMHRITPITRGERRCLVFWTGGRPLR